MSGDEQEKKIDFSVDKNNLYREAFVTDLKVASIRKLIPIKPDGTEDAGRTAIFVGHTQLMSPEGPVPLHAPLAANNFEEAIDAFPEAMKKAMSEMVERLDKMRQQKQTQQEGDSRNTVNDK